MSRSAANPRFFSRVSEALVKANLALAAEREGNFVAAIGLFRSTISMIERELSGQSEARQLVLLKFVRQYEDRAAEIQRKILNCQTVDLSQQHMPFNVIEDTEPIEPPPGSQILMPFWLMRLLAVTMTKGGGISPQLYVPQEVWLQEGAKYAALPPKIEACETILERIYTLEVVSPEDRVVFVKELDDFVGQIVTVQNFLASALPFIPEQHDSLANKASDLLSVFQTRMGFSMSKTASLFGSALYLKSNEDLVFAYIEALVNLFDRSQLFEKMIGYFANDHAITERLTRVSAFFMDVVIAFVLKDLTLLLERYTKHNLKHFADIDMD